MLERDTTSSARALLACAVMLGSIACGSRFQSDDGSGGSNGAMGGTGKGGGASSGGSSSAGALGKGGTLGISGGSSSGGSGAEPGAGGVPPGGGPSGGAGNEGGSMSGTGGFIVGGTGGTGGGMTVSCATDPNCFNCCRETIGNGTFAAVAYECGCSDACYGVCLTYCDEGSAIDQNCEVCIVSEFQNAASNQLCADNRAECSGNLECTKYFNCLSSCEP